MRNFRQGMRPRPGVAHTISESFAAASWANHYTEYADL
jgi:hypothetical protein